MLTRMLQGAYGFTSVTRLELHQVALTDVWVDALMKHFPAVEELRVVGCVVTEMSDLQKLATSFPRLDKLKMGEVLILEDSESDLVPLHRATLSSLRVPSRFVDNRKSATHFLDWMMEESLHMNIDTLEMPIFYPHEALSVDNFLRERGAALKNLCLHMEPRLGYLERRRE